MKASKFPEAQKAFIIKQAEDRTGKPKDNTFIEAFNDRLAPIRGAAGADETLTERHFPVRHQISCQVGRHRRYQLETRSKGGVVPFC